MADLSEVWDALIKAEATVYEWTEDGIAVGTQVIKLGDDFLLTVDDTDGFQIIRSDSITGTCGLASQDEYDEDQAIREASDTEGFFGIVGIPGSQYHAFDWFATEDEADDWTSKTYDATRASSPVIGILESRVVPAIDVLDEKYRDGNRVYFQPRECGQGFVPKMNAYQED